MLTSDDDPHRKIAEIIESAAEIILPGVLGEVPSVAPADDDVAMQPREHDVAGPRAWGFDVGDLNRTYALVLMGGKAVVIKEQADGLIEDRLRVLSIDAFSAFYKNRHTEIVTRDGKLKVITWAQAWLSHRDRRTLNGIEFFPNPDGVHASSGYLNLWRGFAFRPEKGTWAIFRDHLANNVCGGDDELFCWVFGWFAHIVQRPRERVGTALVLRGKMGTGKTKVGEVIGSLFPAHYFAVDDPRYIVGQFNAHMASCLLLQAEEAVWAGDKAAEGRLKGLVTSKFQMIESKGIDPIRLDNFVRLLMTSNEDWVIPAGKDERRFCVLDVNARCAQNHEYFAEMDQELENGGRAALLHDLMRFDLSSINLRQIPKTASLLEQKLRTLSSVESWWFNCLKEGAPARGLSDWVDVIPFETMFRDYIAVSELIGVRRKSEATAFGIIMNRLIPDVKRIRRIIEAEPGVSKRAWCYQLPPLTDCREAFESELGQPVDWGDEDEEDRSANTAT